MSARPQTQSASRIGTEEPSRLTVRPLDDAQFGVEILGLHPGNITADQNTQIWGAYRRAQGLLCFSFDRLLDAHEMYALTAVFGENEYAPGIINGIGKGAEDGEDNLTVEQQVAAIRARGEDPYMSYIGNLNPETLVKESMYPEFFGEWQWHTDMSYLEVPPTFSLLHARQVPDEGGDTHPAHDQTRRNFQQ